MLLFYFLTVTSVSSLNCTSKSTYKASNSTYPFSLPQLPYDASFLSTYLPSRIVNLHYFSHTAAYASKLNNFISLNQKFNQTALSDLVYNSQFSSSLQNFACGLYNHLLYFWTLTAPECSSGTPQDSLLARIQSQWGSFDNFKSNFTVQAQNVFGSGWTWLCSGSGGLTIMNLGFQINPLSLNGTSSCAPILGLDLWDHAYYLKYYADRNSYINDFWASVDWTVVGNFYAYYAVNNVPVPL